MTHKPQWFRSPLDLPAARSGKMQIRHRTIPIGATVNIVGIRQAYLRGLRPTVGLVKEPLRIHELVEDGHGVWMTDLPEELNQIAELLATVKPRGRVLVGGLGLGLLSSAVAMRRGVTHVTTVELNPDVIALCGSSAHRVGFEFEVWQGDIKHYLEMRDVPFDYYLLDTWTGTNERTWWEDVLPLRRIIRRRWGRKPKIHCWAEDIMLGQIVGALMVKEPHWYYRELPVPMSKADAERFAADVGLPAWERKYGAAVDAVLVSAAD